MVAALLESSLHSLPLLARGKVRDNYSRAGRRFIVVTDRISAFDRILGSLVVGDTVYVAIRPNGTHNNDGFGALNFTISFEGIPVPEPSTWAMAAMGLACVGVTGLRRRKA